MYYLIVTIVSVLLVDTLRAATTFNLVSIPVGKEWIYEYEATVHVGKSLHGDNFASTYKINGKLHCQKFREDFVTVYLTDLFYNLHNGRLTANHQLRNQTVWGQYLPIPPEVAQSLTIPFQIRYDPNGQLNALVTDEKDQEFSINIKKSLGSLLQIDRNVIEEYTGGKYLKEDILEQTIYGKCYLNYHIFTTRDNNLMLIKTLKEKKCELQNDEDSNLTTSTANRVYKFEKIGDDNSTIRVKKIQANGQILTYPRQGLDGVYYAKIIQKLTFVNELQEAIKIELDQKHMMTTLKYTRPNEKCRNLSLNTVFDITDGRRAPEKTTELVEKINDLLTQLNLEESINFDEPTIKKSQLVQKLLNVLERADLDTLQQCFNNLEHAKTRSTVDKKKLHLFIQLIPHIGTNSAAILARNLIRDQKINLFLTMIILKSLPTNLKCPSEKLLAELEDMLTMHKQQWDLHNMLVLTYASLIGQTFAGSLDLQSEQTLEKHIEYFVDKMNLTTNQQIIQSIHALRNIGTRSILRNLLAIINGEVEADEYVRIGALDAIGPQLQNDSKRMRRIVMPILVDSRLGLGIRALAYSIYINTEPTYQSFMELHQIFEMESNERFYTFHYNTLKSLSQLRTDSSFAGTQSKLAQILLRISRRPVYEQIMDGIYFHEYMDRKLGFSTQLRQLIVDNEKEMIFQLKMSTHINNVNYELMSALVRIPRKNQGINPFGINDLYTPEMKKQKPWLSLNIPYDIILQMNGKTILTGSNHLFDNVEQMAKLIYGFNGLLFNIPFKNERITTTDLGVPIIITDFVSIIYTIDFSFVPNDMQICLNLKVRTSRNVDMKIYNPVEDVFHGVASVKTFAFDLPLILNISQTNPQTKSYAVSLMKVPEKPGLQMYGVTQVYIDGPSQLDQMLAKFNNGAKVYETVSGRSEYKKKIPVSDVKLTSIGKRIENAFINCKCNISRGTLISELIRVENIIDESHEMTSSLLLSTLIQQYLILSSTLDNCGFIVQLHDLPEVDHVQLHADLGYVDLDDIFGANLYGDEEEHMNTKAVLTTKTHDNVALTRNTVAISTNLILLGAVSNWSAHIMYLHEENLLVKTKIFMHLNQKQLGDRYMTNIQFDLDNEKCAVDINVEHQLSDEQERMAHAQDFIYPQCVHDQVYKKQILLPYGQQCASVASSLNKYSIDISFNRENRLSSTILRMLRALHTKYHIYCVQTSINNEQSVMNFNDYKNYHLDVVFPIDRANELDVKMNVGNNSHVEIYQGIPFKNTLNMLFKPDSLMTRLALGNVIQKNLLDNSRYCLVNDLFILTDHYNILTPIEISNEYKMAVVQGIKTDDQFYTIFVKTVNNTSTEDTSSSLSIKIHMSTRVIEIAPKDNDGYIINGKKLTADLGLELLPFADDSFYAMVTPYPKLLLLVSKVYDYMIMFDGKTISFDVPYSSVNELRGKCVEL